MSMSVLALRNVREIVIASRGLSARERRNNEVVKGGCLLCRPPKHEVGLGYACLDIKELDKFRAFDGRIPFFPQLWRRQNGAPRVQVSEGRIRVNVKNNAVNVATFARPPMYRGVRGTRGGNRSWRVRRIE